MWNWIKRRRGKSQGGGEVIVAPAATHASFNVGPDLDRSGALSPDDDESLSAELLTADDVARANYDASPMTDKEREYASYLVRKSGVDFEQFRHADLTEQIGGLISPFDHLVAFLFGAVPGFLLSMGIWYVFFFQMSDNVRVLMFLFACIFGVVFGVLLGALVDVIRSFRSVAAIIDLAVIAARSVRNEARHVGIEAFRRLTKDEVATGLTWIVFMPVVSSTLRKRMKVKWISAPIIGALQLVTRALFPLELPKDAEAQIAALPPIAAQDRLTGEEELTLLSDNPVAVMTSAADEEGVTQDWIGFLERSRPKVLHVARKTRNTVMIPLVGIALLILGIMVGGAALAAHFLV